MSGKRGATPQRLRKSGPRSAATLFAVVLALLGTLAASVAPSTVSALPPGRSWAPIDTLKIHGHAYMVPDRFEPTRGGRLQLIASGYHGPFGIVTYGMDWQDSTWAQAWEGPRNAYAMWPTITPPERQLLVWKTTTFFQDSTLEMYSKLVTAEIVNGVMTTPDTLARVWAGALYYTGTSWGGRRWVGVRDYNWVIGRRPEYLRVFRSDAPHEWRELPKTGLHEDTFSMVALDSETVLIASVGYHDSLRWGYYRDTTWREERPAFPSIRLESFPQFRPHPQGGYWLTWGDSGDFFVTRFLDGAWSNRDTIRIDGRGWKSRNVVGQIPSLDNAVYPALTWFGYDYGNGIDSVWVSIPSDTGFGVGERVPESAGCINSTIARDENGDVWLAFWREYDGLYWLHTYNHAVCSEARVEESLGQPLVRWRLSEPAPETWWSVLRSQYGGAEEVVARVRATRDTAMQWADTSAPAGSVLRYRVRRECKDVRYRQQSGPAAWHPRGPSLVLTMKSANPVSDELAFEVAGANAGSLELRLFDLQGREVRRQREQAGGTGLDVVRVSLPPHRIPPGVYLLTVRAADGRTAASRKITVVR